MRAPRRIYASWLPPNPRERAVLIQLRRRQIFVIIWLIGILPAGWIATLVSRSGVLLVPLTIFWIVVGLTLAQRVATISCPRCRDDFCSKPEMPYWNALFTLRCESCGLTLNSERSAGA